MTREQLELVTAYVDGEATADERALVEADAELLAEVARQRAVRAELHDVEPPTAAALESAIAAALAVFDDQVANATRVPAPAAAPDVTALANIVSFEQRRRVRLVQSLAAAAAVAAVVVAGAVIATRGVNDDTTAGPRSESTLAGHDSGPVEEGDAAVPPPAAAESATASDAELMIAAETADTTGAAAVSPEGAAEDEFSVDGVAATEPELAAAAPAPPAPPTVAASAAAAAATTASGRMEVVRTEHDLLELAERIRTRPLDADDAESECADAALEAEAVFEDDDGAEHPIVVIAVDDDTIGALALDDCDVVLEADR